MTIAARVLFIAATACAVAACSPSEQQQSGDDLRSDFPLRDAAYFSENTKERLEMASICDTWKASQRPLASWPSVVVSNCNNVDTAKQLLQTKKDRDEFKKGMGI